MRKPLISIGDEVAGWARQMGYATANSSGLACDSPHQFAGDVSIGLLAPRILPPKRFLFGLIQKRRRREFVAVIRMHGRDPWSVEVNGEEHFEEMRNLAHLLSVRFGPSVNPRLVRHKPMLEKFHTDYWF